MKEDELLKYVKKQEQQLAKHAETINQLNQNQQVLVKKLEDFEKGVEVGKRVDDIVKAVKAETKKAENTPPVKEPVKEPEVKEPVKEVTPPVEPTPEVKETPAVSTEPVDPAK